MISSEFFFLNFPYELPQAFLKDFLQNFEKKKSWRKFWWNSWNSIFFVETHEGIHARTAVAVFEGISYRISEKNPSGISDEALELVSILIFWEIYWETSFLFLLTCLLTYELLTIELLYWETAEGDPKEIPGRIPEGITGKIPGEIFNKTHGQELILKGY